MCSRKVAVLATGAWPQMEWSRNSDHTMGTTIGVTIESIKRDHKVYYNRSRNWDHNWNYLGGIIEVTIVHTFGIRLDSIGATLGNTTGLSLGATHAATIGITMGNTKRTAIGTQLKPRLRPQSRPQFESRLEPNLELPRNTSKAERWKRSGNLIWRVPHAFLANTTPAAHHSPIHCLAPIHLSSLPPHLSQHVFQLMCVLACQVDNQNNKHTCVRACVRACVLACVRV